MLCFHCDLLSACAQPVAQVETIPRRHTKMKKTVRERIRKIRRVSCHNRVVCVCGRHIVSGDCCPVDFLFHIKFCFFISFVRLLADTNVVGQAGNKCHVECSRRGLCNWQTGVCSCFEGFAGHNCGVKMAPGLPVPAP